MASQFVVPGKVIRSPIDLHKFQASQAYVVLLNFVVTVNEEISGKKLSYLIPRAVSPLALRVMDLLDDLTSSIEQFPPYTQPQRFGNRAYRDWHGHLVANSETMLRRLLGELDPATVELRPYLEDSFGNPTRIDYGTGHETAFIAFLCCLWRLGHLGPSDVQFFGLRVFPKYLSVCRTLQQRYSMEPAGTRGAWGLDDFHFFPFLWGSAQLIGSAIPPDSVLQDGFLQANGNEFIYVDAVRHITRVKQGPFFEHSPVLYNITAVPSWRKINQGLIKMYKGEVLNKVPIMQHFFFGSLLSFAPNEGHPLPVLPLQPSITQPPEPLVTPPPPPPMAELMPPSHYSPGAIAAPWAAVDGVEATAPAPSRRALPFTITGGNLFPLAPTPTPPPPTPSPTPAVAQPGGPAPTTRTVFVRASPPPTPVSGAPAGYTPAGVEHYLAAASAPPVAKTPLSPPLPPLASERQEQHSEPEERK
ncbi:putative Serine/threonine-protein phosphatase 2A activator [Paratrimastix pyriformis]|uniref:Serine/threonine-protein phosphatase 2A activator n=1 Tax=Paratrimastix pyriformis TaxID=342808 RepID=A0ABQ8UBS0_9EUKA|nr:putative Serine/threonine-protein phosphatase 2A activator [Paratrimastix pyriformis]